MNSDKLKGAQVIIPIAEDGNQENRMVKLFVLVWMFLLVLRFPSNNFWVWIKPYPIESESVIE